VFLVLFDNIKNYWDLSNNKLSNKLTNDIEYMEKNSDNIKKIITYFENKLCK
jgi:uncharacterized protein YutE (UPF0331/DUF86 family)